MDCFWFRIGKVGVIICPIIHFSMCRRLATESIERNGRCKITFTNLEHDWCEFHLPAYLLTHWGRVTHICVGKLTSIGSDNGLSSGRPAPSHYLNQCWNIVNLNLRNKLQWNPRRNSFIFILENAFENVVCEMASIWSRPQWVNADWQVWFPNLIPLS